MKHLTQIDNPTHSNKVRERGKANEALKNNNGWLPITEEIRVPEHDVWICNLKIKGCFFHDALTRIPKKYTHYQIVKRPKPIMH